MNNIISLSLVEMEGCTTEADNSSIDDDLDTRVSSETFKQKTCASSIKLQCITHLIFHQENKHIYAV